MAAFVKSKSGATYRWWRRPNSPKVRVLREYTAKGQRFLAGTLDITTGEWREFKDGIPKDVKRHFEKTFLQVTASVR